MLPVLTGSAGRIWSARTQEPLQKVATSGETTAKLTSASESVGSGCGSVWCSPSSAATDRRRRAGAGTVRVARTLRGQLRVIGCSARTGVRCCLLARQAGSTSVDTAIAGLDTAVDGL